MLNTCPNYDKLYPKEARTTIVISGCGKFSQICKMLALTASVGGPQLTIGEIARRKG